MHQKLDLQLRTPQTGSYILLFYCQVFFCLDPFEGFASLQTMQENYEWLL